MNNYLLERFEKYFREGKLYIQVSNFFCKETDTNEETCAFMNEVRFPGMNVANCVPMKIGKRKAMFRKANDGDLQRARDIETQNRPSYMKQFNIRDNSNGSLKRFK